MRLSHLEVRKLHVFCFQRSSALVSLLDIVPTVLDWLQVKYPKYSIFKHQKPVTLTGSSLLPLLEKRNTQNERNVVFASHNLHEVTMYYPMRVLRNDRYKLIQNFNYKMPFPIDQDFYISPSFQDLLNRTKHGKPLHWTKTLKTYYYRESWELFDLDKDPQELINVVLKPEYANVLVTLREQLKTWQNTTADPWICAPTGVLENKGAFKDNPQCMSMDNGLS